MDRERKILLVYDTDLKAPACVLLQAAMGGSTYDLKRLFLDARTWLLAPTPGMKLLEATEEQWQEVVKITEKARQDKAA